jgi:hypothetical protein
MRGSVEMDGSVARGCESSSEPATLPREQTPPNASLEPKLARRGIAWPAAPWLNKGSTALAWPSARTGDSAPWRLWCGTSATERSAGKAALNCDVSVGAWCGSGAGCVAWAVCERARLRSS